MRASDVQDVYDSLGFTVGSRGCVMLEVEPIEVSGVCPEDWAYHSRTPSERPWMQGFDKGGDHITLLFGLMANANLWRPHVDRVLDGWEPGPITVEEVGFFPSAYPEEDPYSCIIAHIRVTPELLDAHHRLSLLPHINTFPGYSPHLTLGYVKEEFRADAVERFARSLSTIFLRPVGLDYGDPGRV